MLSILVIVIAGISAYIGLFHFMIFLHDRSRRDSIFFAFFCFSIALYSGMNFKRYAAESHGASFVWQYALSLTYPLIALSLLWFILSFLNKKARWPAWSLSAVYIIIFILALVLDPSFTGDIHHVTVRNFTLAGIIDIRYYDSSPGILMQLFYFIDVLLLLYLIYLNIQSFRTGQDNARAMVISLAVLFLGVANDIMVRNGLYENLYLLEYSFFIMIFVITRSLSLEIVHGARIRRQLEESEERYKAIFDNRGTATGIVNSESVIVLCNERFEKMSGYGKEEIEGRMKWTDFVSAQDVERLRSEKTFVMDGSIIKFECRFQTKGHVEKSVQVFSSYMGGTGMYVVSLVDITDRVTAQKLLMQKNAELERLNEEMQSVNQELEAQNEELIAANEEILSSESRFRAIINNSFHLAGLLSIDGRVLAANSAALDFAGVREGDVAGKSFWDTPWWNDSPDRQDKIRRAVERAALGETVRFETEHRNREGRLSIFDFSLRPFMGDAGKILYLIPESIDITDRKEYEAHIEDQNRQLVEAKKGLEAAMAELEAGNEEFEAQNEELIAAYHELEAREQQYRDIFNAASDSLFIVDRAGTIVLVNPTACETYGYDEKELTGMNIFRLVHTDYRKAFEDFLRNMEREEVYRVAAIDIKKDGTTFHTEVRASRIMYRGVPHILSVVRDVSERKKAEDLLVQSEKMMTVGGLAAGMAHEINNPLSVIIQGIQGTLNRISPESEKNREIAGQYGIDLFKLRHYLDERHISIYFDGIQEAAMRAAGIVSSMLNFSRGGSTRISVDLHDIIDESIAIAEKDYNFDKNYDFKHISILKEYERSMGDIPCIPEEIEQVILNVLKNAAMAMWEKHDSQYQPEIRIKTWNENGQAVISIADNGPGMDDRVKRRVFEPFFTTRSPGSGTGLGLSVAYFIITSNHSGSIEVISEVGKGSEFVIKIPLGAA